MAPSPVRGTSSAGPAFAGPGAQLHWRPGGGSPRVALACDGDTGRQVTVVDTRGRVVTTAVVESTPGVLLRTQSCTRGLAGVLVVTIAIRTTQEPAPLPSPGVTVQ
ncbi:hypothetical protein [Janibacter sp. G368]|uniref:hypothetical protein n=1 Tax=Janibacter sp. G368 TaxID=3420441 RepID=UPI003D06DDA3